MPTPDRIVAWRNTPSVMQNFIFREKFTPEMHRNWLATKVATGQVVQYIIEDKATGQPVGSVYYRDVNHAYHSAEYGIFIGEESARGQGFGTETARLFTAFGFEDAASAPHQSAAAGGESARPPQLRESRVCAGGHLPGHGGAGWALPRCGVHGQAGREGQGGPA